MAQAQEGSKRRRLNNDGNLEEDEGDNSNSMDARSTVSSEDMFGDSSATLVEEDPRPGSRSRPGPSSAGSSQSQSQSSGRALQEGDEGTETLTAYEVLARVQKAWLNEKLCTELLVPMIEETDCMLEQLKILEGNYPLLSKRDPRLQIHQMEGERIRYIVVSYLRTRLKKIQKFPWFIQKQEDSRQPNKPSRLSPQEKKFLAEYLENMENHLATNGTDHMPAPASKVPANLLQFQPNLDSYVFFKSHVSADVVLVEADGEEEDVSIEAGSQYVMRYRPVSHLLHAEKIDLT